MAVISSAPIVTGSPQGSDAPLAIAQCGHAELSASLFLKVEQICRQVYNAQYPEVRRAAIRALADFPVEVRDRRIADALIEALNDHGSPLVLGGFGSSIKNAHFAAIELGRRCTPGDAASIRLIGIAVECLLKPSRSDVFGYSISEAVTLESVLWSLTVASFGETEKRLPIHALLSRCRGLTRSTQVQEEPAPLRAQFRALISSTPALHQALEWALQSVFDRRELSSETVLGAADLMSVLPYRTEVTQRAAAETLLALARVSKELFEVAGHLWPWLTSQMNDSSGDWLTLSAIQDVLLGSDSLPFERFNTFVDFFCVCRGLGAVAPSMLAYGARSRECEVLADGWLHPRIEGLGIPLIQAYQIVHDSAEKEEFLSAVPSFVEDPASFDRYAVEIIMNSGVEEILRVSFLTLLHSRMERTEIVSERDFICAAVAKIAFQRENPCCLAAIDALGTWASDRPEKSMQLLTLLALRSSEPDFEDDSDSFADNDDADAEDLASSAAQHALEKLLRKPVE